MKKAAMWIGIAVITPILLFVILAASLYLPPVQNWVADKVAAIASEKTGMDITVGTIRLEWPLDLGIDDFRMLHPNDSLPLVKDTIADIGHLSVNVRLLPLLEKRVIIDELVLRKAKINTNGFIDDLRIQGDLQELWLASKGIDLDRETIEVNGARLSEAHLDIALGDTSETDTTTSETRWIIHADSLSIHDTALKLHLPGDTLNVDAYFGHLVARRANINLGTSVYQVGSLDWADGQLAYDNRFEKSTDGLDFNHIALSDIHLGIDSISYTPRGTSLFIRKTLFKEKSGLEILELTGGVNLDSTYNHLRLPMMTLRTPDSNILTQADLDFNAFDDENPGKMKLRLLAQLGKQDLLRYAGNLPQKFMEHFPNHPLNIRGSVNGNLQHLELTGFDITLTSALKATLNGTAENVTDLSRLKADILLDGQTQNLNFMTALIDPKMSGIYRIPNNMGISGRLTANGTRYGANLTLHEGKGSVRLKGNAQIPLDNKGAMAIDRLSYDADISIRQLNLHHFLPKDSIHTLTADIRANGYGTDLFSNRSRLDANAEIRLLKYGYMDLDSLVASATLQNGRGQFEVTGHNTIFDGTIGADMALSSKLITGTFKADLAKADLYQMRLMDVPLTVGMSGSLDITSDLKQSHYVSGRMRQVYIKERRTTYHPGDIGLLIRTRPDTTKVRAQSGDFIFKLDANSGYEQLIAKGSVLADSVIAQFEQRIIDQHAIKALLPEMKLHLESKQNNPVANLLKAKDIEFKEFMMDLTTSPETGINGESWLYSLNYDSLRIDTIRLNLKQKGERLTYNGQICNNKKNPQFVFNALFDGHVHEHGALAGLRYYDAKGKMGVRLGATVEMEENGLRFKLLPDRPTIGYKEFNLNKDNFVFLAVGGKVQAKVDLIGDDKTGLKLYTENQDSTMLQDLTLTLHQIDLGEITSVIPYLPHMTGKLNGDYHILQDQEKRISVASDMAVDNMAVEGSYIGNISSEFVYLMKEGNAHAIEARLMLDEEEFGLLSGTYQGSGEGQIDATFKMTRFPLSITNGFAPDQIIGMEGYGEGLLTIKGTTVHPKVDGEVFLEDAYLISQPYGIRMRLDSDPVRIVGSHLLLENFGLYAYNDEPLNLMGDIDFTNTDRMTIDLRMRARNLQLIKARQEAKSIAFGKAFVNFVARMQGPLDMLQVRGRLDVLGSTDLTYMLLDSPLSTDNRLDELVKFTDFNDTTQVVVTRPKPTGLNVDLTINVSNGAHILCNLNADQSNYIDLMGGGDLRMRYDSEGINLTGRYTLSSGEMKYSLPVIPLKTFTIKDGSYVEFMGDPMNPRLNITATEQVRTTVTGENERARSVLFNCGVVITQTLSNMGLKFIIEAPEDNEINGDLTSMSAEERGKLAVGMLTTGMYLDNNSGSFNMNSALSSFLQSEINSIAGNALKTLDLTVGVDNATDASGAMHTDYSFKFAKRFLDNRLKIQIGGKVSSGANTEMGQKQSFFDNVSMEYRLNQDATQYVTLFYNQNAYDWLDGYSSEFGGGFTWRRKLSSFWDIFQFWKKEPQPMLRPQQQMSRRDSVKTDSIRSVKTDSIRTERKE